MEKHTEQPSHMRRETERVLGCIAGSVIYGVGVNLFLVPFGLYTGGLLGICQVIRTLLVDYMGLDTGSIDIASLIYYVGCIPIFVYAFPHMEKAFFLRTLISATVTTVVMTFCPTKLIMEDVLASALVGAVLSGFGVGLILRMSGSMGGVDILGVLAAKKGKNMSVGKVSLGVNAVLYVVCLFLFNVQVVIYSILYAVMYSVVVDKVHVQNITMEIKIITKIDTAEMEKEIFEKLNRGITAWNSEGAYTKEPSHVLYILLSKYELPQLRAIVHSYDPHAFIVVDEGIWVDGHYIKKL